WDEVAPAQQAARLLLEAAEDAGGRGAAGGVERGRAAGAEHRLDRQSGAAARLQPEPGDISHLVLVHAPLDGHDQRAEDAGLAEAPQRELLLRGHVLAAQRPVRRGPETVELEVDLDPVAAPRQELEEAVVAGDAAAVRVDHDPGDVP